MGIEQLIKTLRANQQSQIDDIWQATKAEAASLRTVTSEAISSLTESHTDNLVCSCQKSIRTIISEAEEQAQEIQLIALDSLSKLLRETAAEQLSKLINDNYDMVFKKLGQELPPQKWEEITVNPADVKKAENVFNDCNISTDPAIKGGMVAVAMGGKIIVNNTLEKRLERSWSTLFPSIVREIEKKYAESEPLKETTTK